MKNLYQKKGRIHPSPGTVSTAGDVLAVLRILPAAILALTAVLAADDKEVLAYLITRSLNTTAAAAGDRRSKTTAATPSSVSAVGGCGSHHHRPMFDCGCFDCYTSFWSRWDSSANREVIHQAIEAFEEHLATFEESNRRDRRRRDRREKNNNSGKEKKSVKKHQAADYEEIDSTATVGHAIGEIDYPEIVEKEDEEAGEIVEAVEMNKTEEVLEKEETPPGIAGEKRRWPDVIGILNTRLWSLWSPTV